MAKAHSRAAEAEEAATAPPQDDGYTYVYLGNRSAIEVLDDPDDPTKKIRRKIGGAEKNCTTVTIPGNVKLVDAARTITDAAGGAWQAHSNDEAPAWVASSNRLLAEFLAEHYGGIEVRDPEPEQTWGRDAAAEKE